MLHTRPIIRTPDQRLRVFVSSTLQELGPERVAAREAIERLRLVPVMFELGARPHPPQELYRAYLEQSHIFVGLYWQRYGWVAPGMDVSGLEDEWLLSSGLPRLVYLKDPVEGREPRLDDLIDRVRGAGVSYRPFASCDELQELIVNDLAILLSERFESLDEARASAAPASTRVVHARHDVPQPPYAIIGREVELRELETLVCRDDTRLVTITGSGGSGKTRVAVELATRMRERHGWRVVYVDLAAVREPDLVLPTLARHLGVRDVGEDELVDVIASVMADQSVLVVIDNFEHVIERAGDLSAVLAATTDLRMLVTSRQPLRLRWEQEFPLLPLSVPDPAEQRTAPAIATSPSIQLLLDRIHRVRPSFVLTDDNAAALAEIARQLDGLPLALELAAARLKVLQPSDLLRRLEHRLDALATSSPDMPPRHRTLRAAVSWSHDHLSPAEQAVFRRFGVFSGGAGIDAAESVCADGDVESSDVLELLSGLVDKSLVVCVETIDLDSAGGAPTVQTRFRLLETLREYAVEELVAAGEAESTWDRHLEWAASLAERAWSGFWSADTRAWLATAERERDNLRDALDHAAGGGDLLAGLRLAGCMWPYWDVRGRYRDGERRVRALLERSAHLPPSVERGRASFTHGWLVALMGDFESALEEMHAALPMVREHGTDLQLAWSLAEQGNVAFSLGLGPETEALFGECLEIATRLDHVFLIGFGHFGLGYAALLRGDLDEMGRRLDRSLALTRHMYQPWGIAWATFSQGVLSIMQGDTRAAVGPITESLQLRWSIRDARGIAESVQLLATLASAHDEFEWSALLHGSAELQREANGLTILPLLRQLHTDSVARLEAALGEEQLAELWRLGRSMPLEKLVPEALARDTGLAAV